MISLFQTQVRRYQMKITQNDVPNKNNFQVMVFARPQTRTYLLIIWYLKKAVDLPTTSYPNSKFSQDFKVTNSQFRT